MINVASCVTIGKALGWGTFLKCGVEHRLVLGPLFWECPHPKGFTLDYCFFKLIVMSAKWNLFLAPCGLSQSGQSLIIAIYKLTPNQGIGGGMIESRRRPSWNLVSHGIIRIYCAHSVSVCISSGCGRVSVQNRSTLNLFVSYAISKQ
jgi:hypothetical protein